MRKIIFSLIVIVLTKFSASAQDYKQAMETNIKKLDTASAASIPAIANTFERIANAEKNKWEAFYYAAYCYAIMAYRTDNASIDMVADKADDYLAKAVALNDNSETSSLGAMIVACRIMVDPVSRFQQKSMQANTLLEKAKAQDASNPRPYYLQARIQIRTPEAFGGGKKPAKTSLETALEKFKAFVPASSIAPAWGYKQAQSMMDELSK
jgi:hypothetical protein